MRRYLVTLALVLGTAGLCLAEEKPAAKPEMPKLSPDMQAEMESWMKLGRPGKEHQELVAEAGTWKASGKSYMSPDAPTTFTATSTRELMLGGRVLAERLTAEMMGMPFEGHSMTGYDNARKQWWMTWNDNMSTGVLVLYGGWDEQAKARVLEGSMVGPGGRPLKVRTSTVDVMPGVEHYEYWEERDGKMVKAVEMDLTKQP